MNKKVRGIVLREHTEPITPALKGKIRPIKEVIDEHPVINQPQLALWQWMNNYYMCTLGEVMAAALPGGILDDRYSELMTQYISLPSPADSEAVRTALQRAPKQLLVYDTAVRMCGTTGRIERRALLQESCQVAAVLNALIEKHMLLQTQEGISRIAPYKGIIEPIHQLTVAQQKCADEINEYWHNKKNIVLLHGVTSSGKTDIYIHLIQKQLQQGKNVLYLVPEIALTTQLTSRLQHVFGDQLMVYHSRLGDAERAELYHASAKAEPHVVIGARSAVFLPIPALGLVIVDEEHESSYKQADPAPRYHARAAAIVLAQEHGAHVLLGTATPAIESYYLAQKGVYGLVSLSERYAGIELPETELIDLKRQYTRREMYDHFSDPLVDAIRATLAEKRQVILFQNRRGYAPQWQCTVCGKTPRCVQCDVPLTLHMRAGEMRCHYCGYRMPIPAKCPECSGEMKMRGFGTERIEDEIQKLFPEARVLRMDLDTTRNKSAYQDIINSFARHECDILVGTQMVTKGLHFDDVGLVAVLNADPLLNQPDFRAYEHAFQMLEQVAGRAGRKGHKGIVYIQTFDPKATVLQMVKTHDYQALYRQQIAERQLFNYPPFYRLITIAIRHSDCQRVQSTAHELQTRLRQIFGMRASEVIIPSIERIQAYYIREINLRIERSANIEEAKRRLREAIDNIFSTQANKNVKIIVDVDPL
ncbi:MAG: primosomal protein N' [Paludibacteraceae bacterium]|nr:primosomal protein N' [Paludibacteraceae bacterium]